MSVVAADVAVHPLLLARLPDQRRALHHDQQAAVLQPAEAVVHGEPVLATALPDEGGRAQGPPAVRRAAQLQGGIGAGVVARARQQQFVAEQCQRRVHHVHVAGVDVEQQALVAPGRAAVGRLADENRGVAEVAAPLRTRAVAVIDDQQAAVGKLHQRRAVAARPRVAAGADGDDLCHLRRAYYAAGSPPCTDPKS